MIKSVAIISCGPSAEKYQPGDDTLVIGCRDRVEYHACDWWVFGDWVVFQRYRPIFQPMAFCKRNVFPTMQNNDPALAEQFEEYPKFYSDSGEQPGPITTHPTWAVWSGCMALGLAWKLGQAQGIAEGAVLNLWGYDLDGESDAAGWVENAKNRSSSRWEDERRLTDELARICVAAGWEIRQHGEHQIRF